MLRINEILLSVEALTQKCFPELKAYRNVVHQGFQRPSFLTEVGKQTMEDADRWAVERTAQVKLTFFETVDAYHDSQIETLSVQRRSCSGGRPVSGCERCGRRGIQRIRRALLHPVLAG